MLKSDGLAAPTPGSLVFEGMTLAWVRDGLNAQSPRRLLPMIAVPALEDAVMTAHSKSTTSMKTTSMKMTYMRTMRGSPYGRCARVSMCMDE